MAAQIQFRNVTLGYDRHRRCTTSTARSFPARCWRSSARTVPVSRRCSGAGRHPQTASGAIYLGGPDHRDIAYLPQTADIDRSFPISVFDFVGSGLWRSTGLFGGIGKGRARKDGAIAVVGLNGFENRAIGTPRAARCNGHAVCTRVAAGRAPDRIGRAVQRHRCKDLR